MSKQAKNEEYASQKLLKQDAELKKLRTANKAMVKTDKALVAAKKNLKKAKLKNNELEAQIVALKAKKK